MAGTDIKGVTEFYDLSEEFGHNKPLKRIIFLMEKEGCTFVDRIPLTHSSYSDEHNSHYKDQGCVETVLRLDFYTENPDISADAKYLGYTVVRPDGGSTICEAVVQEPRTSIDKLSSFITCKKEYLGASPIEGFPFVQPDAAHLGVCAHAALHMVAMHYGKTLTNSQIQTIASEAIGPNDGLSPKAIGDVIKSLGLYPIQTSFSKGFYNIPIDGQTLSISAADFIYTYVESRIPVLVIFKTIDTKVDHVVVVNGHSFDSNTWWPEASARYYRSAPFGGNLGAYLSSVSWVDFIMHDNNFGPYLTLPKFFNMDVKAVIVPLPRDMSFRAEYVNFYVFWVLHYILNNIPLSTTNRWLDTFISHLNNRHLLLRTFVIDKSSFMDQLKSSDAPEELKTIYSVYQKDLPREFWLTELSIPEIFSQQRYRLGEVISTPDGDGEKALLSIHVPGTFLVPDFSGGNPLMLDIEGDRPYRHVVR